MITLNRYNKEPLKLYSELYKVIKNKNYFIITTNVDGQFEKAGFEKEKIFEVQGDYSLLQCFLDRLKDKNVVLLEIGVGFNTPGIIRFPFEQMTYNDLNTTLIRINKDYPMIMLEISNKTISFDEDTNEVIEDLIS